MLSETMRRVPASPIGAMFERATALRSSGKNLIDLSLGEPGFGTPDHICEAAIQAIKAGMTRYTAADGTAALKDAVRRKFARDNQLQFERSQIVIAAGAKPLIASAMQVLLNPGDKVIITTPAWTSHVGMAEVCAATPVFVETREDEGFRVDACRLEAAISPETKLLLLCSPGNPTGAVASAEELSDIAQVLRRHPHVKVISDDLYEHIIFAPASFATLAQVAPDLSDRVLTVNGLSKAYAMTGWRIGYAGGPDWWTSGLRVLFSQTSGGPCSISQAAGVAALDGPQEFLAERRDIYHRRCNLALSEIAKVPGLKAQPPQGAFFLYVNCRGYVGKRAPIGPITSSTDLAEYLLTAGVVTVPGAAFYADPFLRLSVAISEKDIIEGIHRIRVACSELE
ncbi:pyridoxal phosphate-dependent aminotransferase [Mesorhizobium australafricanum]|uniref:Aminotransferase n=1 Tax=Mesorhizobium australafricanum TaxID=3072311 RepID=A0ABU4X5S4_9HYPH|nr:pyridoxal phosphate-dependent aminotransferase [Mesorhizobium sp. VK3E]MDX8443681.1 pyridoxal phosphate-dependent aminotransferase [Mesorhizobium sp. VK3E]